MLSHKLKLNCSVGMDEVSAEHVIYAHSLGYLYISLFFNMCVFHGYIPKYCMNTVIVPVVKSNKGDIRDVGNYRPIA